MGDSGERLQEALRSAGRRLTASLYLPALRQGDRVRHPLMAQIEQELCEQEGVCVTSAHLHVSGHCAQCRDIAD